MDFEGSAMNIILPVLESATVLAAHYAKACGRDVVVAQDMRMGLMFSARNVLGKQLGSLYPEIYEGSDSDEEEDEEECEWAKYEGDDDIATQMNDCAGTWSAWVPESPAEIMLKKAIDKQLEDDPSPNI